MDSDFRAQAHGLGFQNPKPEPQALSSRALGLGSAGLSRAGLGRLGASSPSLHITICFSKSSFHQDDPFQSIHEVLGILVLWFPGEGTAGYIGHVCVIKIDG